MDGDRRTDSARAARGQGATLDECPPVGVPVAVFDLDGCLAKSPSSDTVTDYAFFESVWANPDYPCNPEVVSLAATLLNAGWHVAILTARPEQYRAMTLSWLRNQGLTALSLTMYPGNAGSGSAWKAGTIRAWLDAGVQVQWMMEDYRLNVEAIRRHVPVLCYEMTR